MGWRGERVRTPPEIHTWLKVSLKTQVQTPLEIQIHCMQRIWPIYEQFYYYVICKECVKNVSAKRPIWGGGGGGGPIAWGPIAF